MWQILEKISVDGPKFHAFSHRLFGFILVFFILLIPVGLHRIWMGRRYWWAHSVGMCYAWLVVKIISSSGTNLNLGGLAASEGILPKASEVEYSWLFLGVVPFFVLWVYDLFAVWFWPMPTYPGETNE